MIKIYALSFLEYLNMILGESSFAIACIPLFFFSLFNKDVLAILKDPELSETKFILQISYQSVV